MKSLLSGILAIGAFTASFAATVESQVGDKVVQPVRTHIVAPVKHVLTPSYEVFGQSKQPKHDIQATGTMKMPGESVVKTITDPIVLPIAKVLKADEADHLVVVSAPDDECGPCRIQHGIVNKLVKDGYDAKIVLVKDFKGSVRKTPTLFYYNGKKNIDIHEGTQSYESITQKLKKPSIL